MISLIFSKFINQAKPWLIFNYVIVLWATAMILVAWLYFQLYLGLQPCPMCINQRIFAILAACCSIIVILHQSATTLRVMLYQLVGLLFAFGGLVVAGRQIWLQLLPPEQVPACGPAFNFVIETFPLSEALTALFLGDGNCAEVKWQLLGISIPGWAAVAFVVLVVFTFSAIFSLKKRRLNT